MAGRGSRLRPHTLTVPKPLVPVAGKPIVHRLVEDIARMSKDDVDEIAFIIGDFGEAVEAELRAVAAELGAVGKIYYQNEALGTAHAVYCAAESLEGPIVVAFADTLFQADFSLDQDADGVLYVKQIENPEAFGVVKLDEGGCITEFVEKPKEFVSDLAMIGIYSFKDGATLKEEIKYLLDNNIMNGGEYQLPDALRRLVDKGTRFKPGKVLEWLDCGNKKVTVYTNQKVLDHTGGSIDSSVKEINSVIIPPCYIGGGVVLKNSIIGPHVSIGSDTKVENSVIQNTIIQKNSEIENVVLEDSMIGNHVKFEMNAMDVSLGDYSGIDQ